MRLDEALVLLREFVPTVVDLYNLAGGPGIESVLVDVVALLLSRVVMRIQSPEASEPSLRWMA